MCRGWNPGELELGCGVRALWSSRVGLCSVGMACGWICLEMDVTMWEEPLACLKDAWSEDLLKFCSSTLQRTWLWWNLVFTENLTNKGQTPVWECRSMCVTLELVNYLLFVLLFQSLQNHYHPDVAKAAAVLNQSLSEMEDDISGLLELSAYEVMLLCLCEWLEPEERRFCMQQPCPAHLPCCWGGSYTDWVTQSQGKPGKWSVK